MKLKEMPAMEADDNYIKWEPKLEIGIPVIDAQHKKLVELCNSFYQTLTQRNAVGNTAWEQPLTDALRECAEYVQTHFKDEETLMKACNYPAFLEHKKVHDSFIKKIIETSSSFQNATTATAFKFVKFLYEWVLSHIAHEDKLYVKYVLDYYKQRKQL